jgi:hypothetical protein
VGTLEVRKERLPFEKKKQKLLHGYRGVFGDSRAKVFWFFFSKKNS